MNSRTLLLVSTALAGSLIAGAALAQSPTATTSANPATRLGASGAPVLQNAAPNSAAAQATAQTGVGATTNPAAANSSQDNLIGEIIVTAEKREQSLQQVPVAISAFTSEKRDLIGIQSIVDQTNYTPGLTYTASNDRLSLRGVGRLTNSHTANSGTAIYVDGVFTTSTIEAGRDPLFVERTEILRGPQGTLYGRNAIGGAFNVISKRPSKEFSGEARINLGNFDSQQYEGRISVPITDWLRTEFGYQKVHQGEGFNHNLVSGVDPDTENGVRDQNYYEAQLEGELGKLDFWLFYEKQTWNNSASPGTTTNGGSFIPNELSPNGTGGVAFPVASFGFTGGLNTKYLGPLATANPNQVNGDLRSFEHDTPFRNTLNGVNIARTHLTYHAPTFDIKYVGGFENYDYRFNNDFDGTSVQSFQVPLNPTAAPITVLGGRPFNCFQLQALGACGPATVFTAGEHNTYEEDEEFYSHELTIASTWDGPLQYIAGIYFYHEKFQYPQDGYAPNQAQLATPTLATSAAFPGVTVAPANPTRSMFHTNTFASVVSKAIYGQIDYKLTSQLKLTAGLRYTQDDKKTTEEERVLCYGTVLCSTPLSQFGTAAPAVDITLLAAGILTPAQVAAGQKQQGVVSAVTYDPVTGVARRNLKDGSNDPTGTLGFEWTPDRRTLLYGKYSRGYKAFGFNAAVGAGFNTFPYSAPEQMDNFEVGLKKDWTRRFQTNITGFYGLYYDAQVPLTVQQGNLPATSIFYNVPRSVIQGVELESTWTPIDKLSILFTYAYLDSHVTKGCCVSDPNDPAAIQPGATPAGASSQGAVDTLTGLPARGQNLAGNQLPFSPKNKIAINANYTWGLGRWGDLIGSASYLWRDEQYSSFFNRSYNLTPSRDQVDLRVTFRDAKNRFDIIAYAQNVFDNTSFETVSGSRLSTGQVYESYTLTDPRTYGLQLQVRF